MQEERAHWILIVFQGEFAFAQQKTRVKTKPRWRGKIELVYQQYQN